MTIASIFPNKEVNDFNEYKQLQRKINRHKFQTSEEFRQAFLLATDNQTYFSYDILETFKRSLTEEEKHITFRTRTNELITLEKIHKQKQIPAELVTNPAFADFYLSLDNNKDIVHNLDMKNYVIYPLSKKIPIFPLIDSTGITYNEDNHLQASQNQFKPNHALVLLMSYTFFYPQKISIPAKNKQLLKDGFQQLKLQYEKELTQQMQRLTSLNNQEYFAYLLIVISFLNVGFGDQISGVESLSFIGIAIAVSWIVYLKKSQQTINSSLSFLRERIEQMLTLEKKCAEFFSKPLLKFSLSAHSIPEITEENLNEKTRPVI